MKLVNERTLRTQMSDRNFDSDLVIQMRKKTIEHGSEVYLSWFERKCYSGKDLIFQFMIFQAFCVHVRIHAQVQDSNESRYYFHYVYKLCIFVLLHI